MAVNSNGYIHNRPTRGKISHKTQAAQNEELTKIKRKE